METEVLTVRSLTLIDSAATSRRSFSATTKAPDASVSGSRIDELVTAIACRRIGRADGALDDLGDGLEQPVAVVVAKRVVDRLEAVEVEHQQCEAATGALGEAQLPFHGREEMRPVVEAREGIEAGQAQGGLAGATLLPAGHGAHVREQQQARDDEADEHQLEPVHGVRGGHHEPHRPEAQTRDEREHQRRGPVLGQRRGADHQEQAHHIRARQTARQAREDRQEADGGPRLEPIADTVRNPAGHQVLEEDHRERPGRDQHEDADQVPILGAERGKRRDRDEEQQ